MKTEPTMTPEQRKAHWALAGTPAMEAWLEYCRAYRFAKSLGQAVPLCAVHTWHEALERHHGTYDALGGWFYVDGGGIGFRSITGAYDYKYVGEDDAIE